MGDCCCSPLGPSQVVHGPTTTVIGDVAVWANVTGTLLSDTGLVAANVVTNPGTAVSQNLALFSDATGKKIADATVSVASLGRLTIVTEAGATRTLTSADAGCYIRFTNAGGCVVTVNNGVFTAGDSVLMRQVAAGAITFAGSATLTPPTTNLAASGQQGATIGLVFNTANAADVMGDLQDA